jgi:hypothetical protein
MFVTALYAVRDSYVQPLKEQFQTLLTLIPYDTHVYVWTDQDLSDIYHPHLHVLFSPLSAFETYTLCMKPGLHLPERRSHTKDTQEYMALMNTKLEFIQKALPHLVSDIKTVAWIDCGIARVFQNKDNVKKQLEAISKYPWNLSKMLTPGCWPLVPVSSIHVHWRFAGGFFLIPVSKVEFMVRLSKAQIQILVNMKKTMLWEVNVWAMIEEKTPQFFHWYKANHDDTILNVPM